MPKTTLNSSWKWLGIAVICGFASVGISEGIFEVLGYDDDKPDTVPLWVKLLIGIPGTLILLTPVFIAVEHAWNARKHKVKGAVIPLIIGALIFAYVIMQTVGAVFDIS
jgi:glycerol uptake facilitator-like aquaporin